MAFVKNFFLRQAGFSRRKGRHGTSRVAAGNAVLNAVDSASKPAPHPGTRTRTHGS